MKQAQLQKKKLPNTPGVYLFKRGRAVLYVGKATSLKSRVRSYFVKDIASVRSPIIARMVEEATTIDYLETDSVLEALILEANLIKKYQPVYNSKEKDDKSFNYVMITKETYPRLLSVRGKDLIATSKKVPAQEVFGPFPNGTQFKEALRLIRKIFPFFDTKQPVEEMLSGSQKKKIYFNQQIGVYPGVPGEVLDPKEYAKTIRHLKLFFEGKKKALLSQLEKEMKAYAKQEAFEKATEIRKKLFALTHIRDVSLIKEDIRTGAGISSFRIEAYDVAHTSGKQTTGVMVVVEDGEVKKSDYRKFKISNDVNNDIAGLREILLRRFAHTEWPYPKLIVVDGGKAQVNGAKKVLVELGYEIPIIGVVKDEHHRPRGFVGGERYRVIYEKAIILANSEAHRFAISYHRKLRGKIR
jgi:excinuclease ABC subunit C